MSAPNDVALEVPCTVCQAKPGQCCTQPTDTGRRQVLWYHSQREGDAAAHHVARAAQVKALLTPAEPTEAQYAQLGRFAAALLGSQAEWNGGDICEGIAEAAAKIDGFPTLGDQTPDECKLWRGVADQLGIEYPDDDDEVTP